MWAHGLQSHRWRNCSIGGTVLASGFIDALLRSRGLLGGVGASSHRAVLKQISTCYFGVNSRRHRRIGARSLFGRLSIVWTTIDQDTARAKFTEGQLKSEAATPSVLPKVAFETSTKEVQERPSFEGLRICSTQISS
jgi:hypothetical protein